MPAYFGYLVAVAIVLGAFEVAVDESFLVAVQLVVHLHFECTFPCAATFDVPAGQILRRKSLNSLEQYNNKLYYKKKNCNYCVNVDLRLCMSHVVRYCHL